MKPPDRPAGMAPQALTLRIEKPVYGGSGLARDQGRVVFTPFTLVGELVSATVTNTKSSFAEASLDRVLEPAASRTEASCPHFGVCGGCHYQHAEYPAQVAMKTAILEETLTRAGLRDLPPVEIHTGSPFGYRNRIRLHIDATGSALGYRERGAHRLLRVESCPIAMPILEQALPRLQKASAEQRWGLRFSSVELSTNHDGSEVLMLFELRGRASSATQAELERSCVQLRSAWPQLTGASVYTAPAEGRASGRTAGGTSGARRRRGAIEETTAPGSGYATGAVVARWGRSTMTYQVAGRTYQVSAGAFFQVNHTLVDKLVALATGGRGGTLAWDLYAGAGLFSLALAESFRTVIAVEGAPVSALDLRANLASIHDKAPGEVLAVERSTLDFLHAPERLAQRGVGRGGNLRHSGRFEGEPSRPDFVLVDPPRAGLGAEVTRRLVQFRAKHVTYVSCDPSTLSRDLRLFVESGYRIESLHLIDLFPQTFHLETVAALTLG